VLLHDRSGAVTPVAEPTAMRRTFFGLALMIAGLCALVQHLQMN
jgi:hypothetical protein